MCSSAAPTIEVETARLAVMDAGIGAAVANGFRERLADSEPSG